MLEAAVLRRVSASAAVAVEFFKAEDIPAPPFFRFPEMEADEFASIVLSSLTAIYGLSTSSTAHSAIFPTFFHPAPFGIPPPTNVRRVFKTPYTATRRSEFNFA